MSCMMPHMRLFVCQWACGDSRTSPERLYCKCTPLEPGVREPQMLASLLACAGSGGGGAPRRQPDRKAIPKLVPGQGQRRMRIVAPPEHCNPNDCRGGRLLVIYCDLHVLVGIAPKVAIAVTVDWVVERSDTARAVVALALPHRHRPGLFGHPGDAALRAFLATLVAMQLFVRNRFAIWPPCPNENELAVGKQREGFATEMAASARELAVGSKTEVNARAWGSDRTSGYVGQQCSLLRRLSDGCPKQTPT